MQIHVEFEVLIANDITLTAPPEPGLKWQAQVWMFDNAFLVEHENPYQAVATVVRELKQHDLYKMPGEREYEMNATHLVAEEILDDEERQLEEEQARIKQEQARIKQEQARIKQEQARIKQEQLRDHAGFYADRFRPGEAGFCKPDDAQWEEVDQYPLDKLLCREMPTREDWTTWLADEINLFVKDGMSEIADMYRAMMDQEIENHIIVLERDGVAHVWDGDHRTGAAFAGGKTTIPAIVGKPVKRIFGEVI